MTIFYESKNFPPTKLPNGSNSLPIIPLGLGTVFPIARMAMQVHDCEDMNPVRFNPVEDAVGEAVTRQRWTSEDINCHMSGCATILLTVARTSRRNARARPLAQRL